jgi:hypothetical protein
MDGHGLSLDLGQTLLAPSAQETLTDAFDDDGFDEFYGLIEPEEVVVVRPYGGDDDELVLAELRPRFVVMYDPDPAFVRRIEVSLFQAIEAIAHSALGLQKLKSWPGSTGILYDVL